MMNHQASIPETFLLAMLETLLRPDQDCCFNVEANSVLRKENLMSVKQIRFAENTMCK